MRERLMYVEAKARGHAGEAWVGLVSFSKTGATLYFNGRAYRTLNGSCYTANYCDVETGEPFWISGVKKRGTNRHPFGSGVIKVDRRAVSALLERLSAVAFDCSRYVVGDAADTSGRRAEWHEQENARLADDS